MSSEPAAGIGLAMTAFVALVWAILAYSGVALTEGLKDAAEAFIYAMMALPAVAGLLIRIFVTPTAKAEEKIEEAYVAVPGVTPKPTL